MQAQKDQHKRVRQAGGFDGFGEGQTGGFEEHFGEPIELHFWIHL